MPVVSLWLVPIASDRPHLTHQIQTLAQQHQTVAFDPHMTLCHGIVDSIDAIIPTLYRVAAKAPHQFELTTAGIQTGDRFSKTVFIQLTTTPTLAAWRNQLCAATDLPKSGFDPHVSLLYKAIDLSSKRAIAQTLPPPSPTLAFGELWVVTAPDPFQTQTDVQQLCCVFKTLLGQI